MYMLINNFPVGACSVGALVMFPAVTVLQTQTNIRLAGNVYEAIPMEWFHKSYFQ